MYLKAYEQNLVKNGQVVSEKSKFLFSYVNDIGPRSRNYLVLQYLHIFINSISFRSQAAIVSEKSTSSYVKTYTTKFNLAVK